MREAKLRVKISQNFIFDANLRFAILASLCSASFSKNEATKLLVSLPAGVKHLISHFVQQKIRYSLNEENQVLKMSPPFLPKRFEKRVAGCSAQLRTIESVDQ